MAHHLSYQTRYLQDPGAGIRHTGKAFKGQLEILVTETSNSADVGSTKGGVLEWVSTAHQSGYICIFSATKRDKVRKGQPPKLKRAAVNGRALTEPNQPPRPSLQAVRCFFPSAKTLNFTHNLSSSTSRPQRPPFRLLFYRWILYVTWNLVNLGIRFLFLVPSHLCPPWTYYLRVLPYLPTTQHSIPPPAPVNSLPCCTKAPPRIKQQSITRLITLIKVSLMLHSFFSNPDDAFCPSQVATPCTTARLFGLSLLSRRIAAAWIEHCTPHGLIHLFFLSTNPSLASSNHQTSRSDRVARPYNSEWDPLMLAAFASAITNSLVSSLSVLDSHHTVPS